MKLILLQFERLASDSRLACPPTWHLLYSTLNPFLPAALRSTWQLCCHSVQQGLSLIVIAFINDGIAHMHCPPLPGNRTRDAEPSCAMTLPLLVRGHITGIPTGERGDPLWRRTNDPHVQSGMLHTESLSTLKPLSHHSSRYPLSHRNHRDTTLTPAQRVAAASLWGNSHAGPSCSVAPSSQAYALDDLLMPQI